MTALVGAGRLVRLIVRRDRIRLAAWVLALGAIPAVTAASFAELYPTEESREALAATIGANPAFTAILGPLQGSSIGALTAWRLQVIVGTLAGVMAVTTVVRHTRLEEETGRRELLGSTVLGRHAPLAAALAVAGGASTLIGALQAGSLLAVGLEAAGSLAFGVATAGMGLAFAGVGALAAQLSPATGVTRGIGLAVIGASFLLRIVADSTGLDALRWASPHGWAIELAPYAGARWPVALLWLGGLVVTGWVAVGLSARRDVGEGLFSVGAGPARAGWSLSGPGGLAWRQHRAGLLGWASGVSMMGLIMGGFAESIGEIIADTPQIGEILALLGGVEGITDAFFTAFLGILGMLVAAHAVRTVLRLQAEDSLLRAELVLSTAVTRTRLAGSHLLFAFVGPPLMLAVAGGLAGLVHGMSGGDPVGSALRILAASLAQAPAVWVVAGATMLLYGAFPRLAPSAWGLLVVFLLLGQLGPMLRLPGWAMNLSPFTHVPPVLVDGPAPVPLAGLVATAFVLAGAGLSAFRRRDIPTA